MFKHILLPLDGSQLAESAIPVAVDLIKTLGAEIILLHVIEKNAPVEIHGQHHLSNENEAHEYLEKLAAKWFSSYPKVVQHVHSEEVGQVSRSIIEHSGEFSPDLILLSAHGEGGLRDFVAGSIAQQVVANGKVPVLLIQPDEMGNTSYTGFHSFLVPLDGDPDHELVFKIAIKLAKEFKAKIRLVRVVPTLTTLSGSQAAAGTLLPSTTNAYLDIEEEEVAEYLTRKISQAGVSGVDITAEVRRGDPAHEVVKSAEEFRSDLILLGTHGKSGMNAFWSGSTAPKIVSRTRLPILLLPVRRN